MKKLLLLTLAIATLTSMVYSQTVTIGTQVWSTKNLDVSTFRNGDPIPQAKSDDEWAKAGENKQAAWCYYKNDPANGAKYGKLYNWYAVNDPRGLAPVGYHIPTTEEWGVLAKILGNDSTTGPKLKTINGWGQWETKLRCSNCKSETEENKMKCEVCKGSGVNEKTSISLNGNNQSGFDGFPGGARGRSGEFGGQDVYTIWWSTTEQTDEKAYYLDIDPGKKGKVRFNDSANKKKGSSVRCLRD